MTKETKKYREELGKISEQILGGIVQGIEAAVVLHDRDLRVVFINEAFKNIYEISEQDVMGRSPMEFLPDSEESQKKAIYSRLALKLASRAYILEVGNIVLEGDTKELADDEAVKKAYLGG